MTAIGAVDAARPRAQINRNIYGHFSEHLGRCTYGGLYVGEDSPIPNVNGMRTDVVEALKKLQVPVLRWPGGCFRRRIPLARRNRPQGGSPPYGQHQLGRRGRG